MAITVTNQVASQALRGQAVTVTLDSTDALQLPNILIGAQCTVSGSKKAIVYSVDTYGNSFKITPVQPDFSCSAGTPGYLSTSDTVVVNV